MKGRGSLAVVLVVFVSCTSMAPPPAGERGAQEDETSGEVRLGNVSTAEVFKRLCRYRSVQGGPASSGGSTPSAVGEVQRQVQEIRGLALLRPVPVEAVTATELQRGIRQLVVQTLPVDMYGRRSLAWQTIGAVPKGTDLVKVFKKSSGAGVIGYYVPQIGRLRFIGTQSPSPDERFTLAHELTHAIDDQHFDLTRFDQAFGNCRDDEALAYQSLVEGNATYFMRVWALRFLSPIERFGVSLKAIAEPHGTVRGVPNFLRDGAFPYLGGLKFVQGLVRQGGVGAIDAAFRHPPVSTEQILHPKKYPKDRPRRVEIPDYGPALGRGWKDLDVEEVGEEWLRSLLGLRLTTSSAEIAAEGWDGGVYRAWSHGDDAVVVLSTVWDSHAEASEFAVRIGEWILGDQSADVLPVEGDRVTVVFASDGDTLLRLKALVETVP